MPHKDDPSTIECCKHGRAKSAIVCGHHVQAQDRAVGFIENSADPDDLQAWCGECEAVFVDEGGMTKTFRAFNGMSVVCVSCYEELKQRHSQH